MNPTDIDIHGSTDPDGAAINADLFFGKRIMLTVWDDGKATSVVLNRREVKTLRRWLKENMPDA